MQHERGNIYAYAVLTIAVLGALWRLVVAWHSYTNELIAEGAATERSATTLRDNKALSDALLEVKRLSALKDKIEKDGLTTAASIAIELQEKVRANKNLADANRLLSDNATRRVSRDDAFIAACPSNGDDSRATGTAANPASAPATPTCQLSQAAKRSLREIGLEADQTALSFDACVKLLIADRQMCGAVK